MKLRKIMVNRNSLIVPDALPFIISLLIINLILACFGYVLSVLFFFIAMLFVIWFFRNPERKTTVEKEMVLSPADGKIIKIETVYLDDLVKGNFKKISIFMNIFNVHVNRVPYSGTIRSIRYRKGSFISANFDKASSANEQNAIVIVSDDGKEILVVQIAGLIARRIVCWIEEGMRVERGERFGLIRFGSRLDVYLPLETHIKVKLGDKVRAGQTALGALM